MPSSRKAQIAFIFAVILLLLSGTAAYISIAYFRNSERRVVNSLEVQSAFGSLDFAFAKAARARTAYISTGDMEFLHIFESSLPEIGEALHHIQLITRDNPQQQILGSRLQELTEQRVALLRKSVDLKNARPQGEQEQDEITREGVPASLETTATIQQMRDEEKQLLAKRQQSAAGLFLIVGGVLVSGFALAIVFLFIHYRLLTTELKARRHAEQIVRDSEERLKLALDSAEMGAWDLDIDRDKYVRSPRYDEIFGYSTSQVEWNTEIFLRHVFREDHDKIRAAMEEAYKTEHLVAECRIVWPDKSIHWIALQGHAYTDARGKVIRMMGVVSDISERKMAEEEVLLQNAQLEAVNKELETFSYSVSHDLRAPLRAIDGFSLALMEDCEARLTDSEQNYLTRIRAGAKRMGELIDDLLKLARTSRCEMIREQVDLSGLAQEIASQFPASEAGWRTKFTISSNMVVIGDRGLLKVALENLLDNARKFSSKRPDPSVEFGVQQQGGQRVYFVRDNGAGFDMQYADKLFNTFQRLHEEQEYPGTGVGLASVQRIIQRHGGRIWAESVPGQGATFYFTLDPIEEERAA